MIKKNIHKILCIIAALLLMAFSISFGIDVYYYRNYGYMGSAPLDVYLLVRAIEFLLPSVILFTVSIICKRKLSKNKSKDL